MIIAAAVVLVVILGVGMAVNHMTAGAGDYNFYNFSLKGFMPGADTNETNTPETILEPITPEWSPEQNIGADMAFLDYASDDIVIFHGYFGLFIYDLDSLRIIRSLDLKPLNCHYTQGDNYCEVSVSTDGDRVELHPLSSETMYVYTVADNTLKETAYQPMEERFGSRLVPIEEVISSNEMGAYSFKAVKFDTGEYGYLHIYDWTLGTLSYVRDDMMYRLFGV